VKIGPAVPEICSRTDRETDTQTYSQTDKLIAILCRGGIQILNFKTQTEVHYETMTNYYQSNRLNEAGD